MSPISTKVTPAAGSEADNNDELGTVEQIDRSLDAWRAKIDELKVQVDLASLNLREDVAKRLEVTENVYLTVRTRLADVGHDVGSNTVGLRRGIDDLLRDLRRTYEDAEAVVRRSQQV